MSHHQKSFKRLPIVNIIAFIVVFGGLAFIADSLQKERSNVSVVYLK